jgi:hypothetical protein
MPYTADIQAKQDHIRVEVSGDRSAGDAVANADQVGQQVVQECQTSGINQVLLIARLIGHASAIDIFEIVTGSEKYGWKHDIKLAFVDLNSESIDDVRFMETVAFNRAYRVRVFDNEADASQWLLGC